TSIRSRPKRQLDVKLLRIVHEAPSETGVYYFYNDAGSIIYIGKSKNIKKRVTQHFTSQSKKSKRIQELVATFSYEITGSNLVAELKESEAIKINKPLFNRALRRNLYLYQIGIFEDKNGYLNLKIEKTDFRK